MSHYDQYLEGNVLTASPVELVRMVYRFVIESLRDATHCTRVGDIQGRGQAVSKATEGILELKMSLDCEQGGNVSSALDDLYGYMVSRVLQGHIDQDSAPFEEVEKLMATLLDGWEAIRESEMPQVAYGVTPESYAPVSASF